MASSKPIYRRQPYPYIPLCQDEGDQEVRIAKLRPGRRTSPLRIELFTAKVNRLRSTWYEAVSYVWGYPKNPVTITVRDGRFCWTLQVTRNCAEVLRHFRQRHKTRYLWIDAICINQQDLDERAKQVQHMTAIYRRATRVIVWLGPASHNSHVAMGWLQHVGRFVCYDEDENDVVISSRHGAPRWLARDNDAIYLPVAEASSLADLLSRTWFTRLWIWQEVHMGDERAVVHCGKMQMPWPDLRAALLALVDRAFHGRSENSGLLHTLDKVWPLCYVPSQSQLYQLQAMRLSNCGQPNDRIYTAHALALSAKSRFKLEPDYKKPHQQVYTEWAIMYVQHKSDLDLLTFIAPQRPRSNLPSWVPDWSQPMQRFDVMGRAHAGRRSDVVTIDHQQLVVKGILVDTVWQTFERHNIQTNAPEAIHCLRKIAREVTSVRSLCKVMRQGYFNDRVVPTEPPYSHDLKAYTATLEKILDGDTHLQDSNTMEGIIASLLFHPMTQGWHMFITADKKLGMAPNVTEGDTLAVLLGCRTPLLLRSLQDGKYQVHGLAYVDGLMESQAILGPLPPSFRSVHHVVGDFLYPAFKDDDTGLLHHIDPRLPPLPEEWENITDPAKPYEVRYRHRETGEERWTNEADPRNDWLEDLDAFEAHGLKLQDFTLI